MIQIPDSTNWPMLDAAKVADWVASVSDERIAALIGGMPLPGFLREQRDEMVATVKTALRRQAASPPPDRMHSDHDINRNPIAVAGPYLNSSSSVRPQGPAIASVNSMLTLPGPPNSLLTPADAARRLGCSVKTLAGHVASGALRYVNLGHGKRRQRRMFSTNSLPIKRARTRLHVALSQATLAVLVLRISNPRLSLLRQHQSHESARSRKNRSGRARESEASRRAD